MFDFGEAVRDALDVYYFPGMWEWNRAIVRPQAVEGFRKSMRRQRDAYTQHRELTGAQHDEWEHQLRLGTDLLERYFSWARHLDRFTPLQVSTQFDVTVPDPQSPHFGLTTPDGRAFATGSGSAWPSSTSTTCTGSSSTASSTRPGPASTSSCSTSRA